MTADSADQDRELAQLSYEQARTELASVVERLEAGGCTLEESLALWERGEALAEVCERRLEGARARLDRATEPASDSAAAASGSARAADAQPTT